MKLIIDIPEECVTQDTCFIEWVKAAGDKFDMTILPKEHGRLIDADRTIKNAEEIYNASSVKDIITPGEMYAIRKTLTDAPTIIEADGGDRE